ncbi:MAG: DUF1559 domain-containing protein [Gemmataceae bacterium]
MRNRKLVRCGLSLIELLVVIAILGVLLGLLLVAIQKARETAALLENKNNLRQIILATHQLASETEGVIPDVLRSSMPLIKPLRTDTSLFYRLVPYVHGPRTIPSIWTNATFSEYVTPDVKVYRNRTDPSWDYDPGMAQVKGKISYGLNIVAMDGTVNLSAGLPDGSSHTIAYTDKYAEKGSRDFTVPQTVNIIDGIWDPLYGNLSGTRRATFADRGWEDVLPVTDPETRTTRPSVPGKTFLVRPRPEDVDQRIPQTPHRAGLTVALFDGSVRSIAPSVDETVFWAMVTPAGGEVIGPD